MSRSVTIQVPNQVASSCQKTGAFVPAAVNGRKSLFYRPQECQCLNSAFAPGHFYSRHRVAYVPHMPLHALQLTN
jgi:hypothetical protein